MSATNRFVSLYSYEIDINHKSFDFCINLVQDILHNNNTSPLSYINTNNDKLNNDRRKKINEFSYILQYNEKLRQLIIDYPKFLNEIIKSTIISSLSKNKRNLTSNILIGGNDDNNNIVIKWSRVYCQLLCILTRGINISSSNIIMKDMIYLINSLIYDIIISNNTTNTEDIDLVRLALLCHLVRNSETVRHIIKERDDVKIIYITLIEYLSITSDLHIVMFSFGILVSLIVNDPIESQLLDAVNIRNSFQLSFQFVLNGLFNSSQDTLLEVVDLFTDLIASSSSYNNSNESSLLTTTTSFMMSIHNIEIRPKLLQIIKYLLSLSSSSSYNSSWPLLKLLLLWCRFSPSPVIDRNVHKQQQQQQHDMLFLTSSSFQMFIKYITLQLDTNHQSQSPPTMVIHSSDSTHLYTTTIGVTHDSIHTAALTALQLLESTVLSNSISCEIFASWLIRDYNQNSHHNYQAHRHHDDTTTALSRLTSVLHLYTTTTTNNNNNIPFLTSILNLFSSLSTFSIEFAELLIPLIDFDSLNMLCNSKSNVGGILFIQHSLLILIYTLMNQVKDMKYPLSSPLTIITTNTINNNEKQELKELCIARQAQFERVFEEKQALNSEISSLQYELQTIQGKLFRSDEDIKTFEGKLLRGDEEVETHKGNLSRRNDELQNIQMKLSRKDEENKKLKKNIIEFEESKEAQSREYQALDASHALLLAELQELRDSLRIEAKRVNDLKKDLEESNKREITATKTLEKELISARQIMNDQTKSITHFQELAKMFQSAAMNTTIHNVTIPPIKTQQQIINSPITSIHSDYDQSNGINIKTSNKNWSRGDVTPSPTLSSSKRERGEIKTKTSNKNWSRGDVTPSPTLSSSKREREGIISSGYPYYFIPVPDVSSTTPSSSSPSSPHVSSSPTMRIIGDDTSSVPRYPAKKREKMEEENVPPHSQQQQKQINMSSLSLTPPRQQTTTTTKSTTNFEKNTSSSYSSPSSSPSSPILNNSTTSSTFTTPHNLALSSHNIKDFTLGFSSHSNDGNSDIHYDFTGENKGHNNNVNRIRFEPLSFRNIV